MKKPDRDTEAARLISALAAALSEQEKEHAKLLKDAEALSESTKRLRKNLEAERERVQTLEAALRPFVAKFGWANTQGGCSLHQVAVEHARAALAAAVSTGRQDDGKEVSA